MEAPLPFVTSFLFSVPSIAHLLIAGLLIVALVIKEFRIASQIAKLKMNVSVGVAAIACFVVSMALSCLYQCWA